MAEIRSSGLSALASLANKAATQPPNPANSGSVAEEIRSNADVEGNLNSKFLYNQSKTENEGLSLPKTASYNPAMNKYIEKIAAHGWFKSLGTSIKNADPLTQMGVGSSVLGLGLSASKTFNDYRSTKTTGESSKLQERSLRALNSINKSLSTAVIKPSPVAVQRPDPKKGL